MAVKLRLMRMGKKKQPSYRVVAADARSPRDGRFIEIVGIYDPRAEPSTIRIDNDKATGWLRKGAQPTESVRRLLQISGAWDEFEATKAATKVASPTKASTTTATKASASKATGRTTKASKATKATKSTAKASRAGGAAKSGASAAGGTAKKAAATKKATKRTTKAAESSASTDEDAS